MATTPPPSHEAWDNHAPERIPSRDMLYEESFYSGRQTALILGAMGIGFAGLIVLLLVVGFGG
ncbi:MAG: hypothetical protein ABJF88_01930 [Rhodothermales bacterium]